MFEVTAENVQEFLQGLGNDVWSQLDGSPAELSAMSAEELAWGVSNIVIRIDLPDRSFVLKQSRKQLRTQIDWFSQLERIWREVDVLRVLEACLPVGAVPRVLAEDRNNYLFVMEAIEKDHRVWKADLLAGEFDASIPETLGSRLATIHRETSANRQLRQSLGDQTSFDELRLDPFYRYVANTHDEYRAPLTTLIDQTAGIRECMVLADFSPKNILLTSRGPVIVDFETGHYGDPGFDVGFFLSHLLLKTVLHSRRTAEMLGLARSFWSNYQKLLHVNPAPQWVLAQDRDFELESRCVQHLAACMLARIIGKSRIDYLQEDSQQVLVQKFCLSLFDDAPPSVESAMARLEDACARIE